MAVLLIIITLLLMLIVTILSIPLTYTVRLYIVTENEYGETIEVSKGNLCTLNAEKVKRYKDYAHFKEAYPIYYYMEKKCFPRLFNNRY